MLFGYEWDLTNNWTFAWSILPMLLRGMVVTIQATLLGMGIALVLGLAFALLKMVPLKIISWPVNFVLEFVRNTPLLVQLYFLRSEEHTSELQSRGHLVCRLLLEKKNSA